MEGKTLTVNVPWHALCSDNRKYKFRFVLSVQYRDAKALIGLLVLQAARQQHWGLTEDPVSLNVVVREPDKRRRDFNWSKNLKDGITLCGGVWKDDQQVREERWVFDEGPRSREKAGATITITKRPRHECPPDAVRTRPTKNARNRRTD